MDYFPGNWGNPRTRESDLFSSNDYFPGKYASDVKPHAKADPITHTRYLKHEN